MHSLTGGARLSVCQFMGLLLIPSLWRIQGGYRLYISDKLSFEKNFNLAIEHGPDCSSFTVSQRQIPVSKTIEAFADEYNLIDREYIGSLFIKKGTNTLTIKLYNNPEGALKGSFSCTGFI